MTLNLANLVTQNLNQPTVLYHGSAFEATELKPGYQHTGKLTTWDKFESNAYLYASDCRIEAELLGISSAWEKKFPLENTHIDDDAKIIKLVFSAGSKIPTLDQLKDVVVYLYTIKYTDQWKKNNNPHNNIDTEYKTKDTITAIEDREVLDVPEILKDFQITLRTK